MSGRRGGMGGGAVGVEIPANTRKAVQSLKEIVGNSEEEIYAMLKECNMDSNETVQRLLNQDPFHEVKRKRDKKKEGGANKESTELKGRSGSGGSGGRGGRGGAGRGSSVPRHLAQEFAGGRGRPSRENGIHLSSRGASATSSNTTPALNYGQSKPILAVPSSLTAPAGTVGSPGSLTNGTSLYVRSTPGPQGSWGSGHVTMAEILKSNGAPPLPPVLSQAPSAPLPPPPSLQPPAYSQAAPLASSPSSGFYSSSDDPVLHPSLDPRVTGVGALGTQRPIGDRQPSSICIDIPRDTSQQSQSSHSYEVIPSVSLDLESEVQDNRAPSPSVDFSSSLLQDSSLTEGVAPDHPGESVPPGMSGSSSLLPVIGGSQFNGRPIYQLQQQPVGTQKGAGLEWKPKATPQIPALAQETTASASMEAARLTAQLQVLSMRDEQPVIIPRHLQVPEADRTGLSFGSFGSFGTSFSTSFGSEDPNNTSPTIPDSAPPVETPLEQPSSLSVAQSAELTHSYGHQAAQEPLESLASSKDDASHVSPQLELAKPDPVAQQNPQYPYLPPVSNYSGFGLMPQLPSVQYGYESTETQPQDISRLPSLMYSDPATSYYTPAFRQGTEGEGRYAQYVTPNTASKYSGNIGLITGPNIPSSQETGNPMLSSSGPSSAPTSQPGNNSQTTSNLPQQALPMQAYATQQQLGHLNNMFSYQYIPPNYPQYIHPSYQQNYNQSNNTYAQPTTGSTYPSAVASVKYPLGYKPGTGSGNTSHPSAGAGAGYGYSAAPSGYSANPSVTAGTASGYDDVGVSQYKDSAVFVPNHQGEGPGVWIHQVPREMGPTPGMQTNSYYNVTGQGQHSGYAHTQQPPQHQYPGAAYNNLYHPSQSGPNSNTHQIHQQQQSMGGAGNTQAAVYQQSQRTQQPWATNY